LAPGHSVSRAGCISVSNGSTPTAGFLHVTIEHAIGRYWRACWIDTRARMGRVSFSVETMSVCLSLRRPRNTLWPGTGQSPVPGGLRRAGVREAACPQCPGRSWRAGQGSIQARSIPELRTCGNTVCRTMSGGTRHGGTCHYSAGRGTTEICAPSRRPSLTD